MTIAEAFISTLATCGAVFLIFMLFLIFAVVVGEAFDDDSE